MECTPPPNMTNLHFKRQHKNIESCELSVARVIKTIRLRYNNMEPWIRYSEIKVWFPPVVHYTEFSFAGDPSPEGPQGYHQVQGGWALGCKG